jgi:hypothetical protein
MVVVMTSPFASRGSFVLTVSVIGLIALLASLLLVGCAGRPQLFPNSDKALQKTSTEFAADAAKRFPYKMDVPRAGLADARAQIDYTFDVLEIANLSDEDWEDVEVWVNQQYVVYIPKMESHALKHLTFQMIFNDGGFSFPTNNMKTRIEKLEILYAGKMYEVKLQLAD